MPGLQLAARDAHAVHDQALDRTLDVEHLELDPVAGDRARVGVLPAGLGVEGRALEHDLDDVALGRARDLLAVEHDAAHARVVRQLAVAGERA